MWHPFTTQVDYAWNKKKKLQLKIFSETDTETETNSLLKAVDPPYIGFTKILIPSIGPKYWYGNSQKY